MTATKFQKIAPFLTVVLAAAVIALIASGAISGYGEASGPKDQASINGYLSQVVFDKDGNEVSRWDHHNTVNIQGLDNTFRMITTGTNYSTGGFDAIAALSAGTSTDDPADGVVSGSVALLLDGSGDDGTHENPADGVVTTAFGTERGNGTVVVTFTAKGAVTIEQIVLTSVAEDDTASGGAVALPDPEIFAYIDVPNVSLGTGDSVQYTWTIDVD